MKKHNKLISIINDGVVSSQGSKYGYQGDGVNKRIDLDSSVSISTDYSFSFWFKGTVSAANHYLISSSIGIYHINMNWGQLQVTSADNSFDMTGAAFSGYNDGEWHQAFYTYNRTSGAFKCYIDAVLIKSQTATTGVDCPPINKFLSNGSTYADYRLDDIQVYNVELSLIDIQTSYNDGYVINPLANLVHHWKLGESDTFSSNWTVVDSVGGLNGTSVNMVESDRKMGVGYSGVFNGTDEYVNHGNNLDKDGSTSFSVSFWANPDTTTGLRTIVSKYDGSKGYIVRQSGSGLEIYLIDDLGGRIRGLVASVFNTGLWAYWTVTYDGSKDVSGLKAYRNADLKTYASTTNTFTTSCSNTANFTVGSLASVSQLFDGFITRPQIHNKVLNQLEVDTLYNNGVPVTAFEAGLSDSAELDCIMFGSEDTATTIKDYSSNGYDGTLVNMDLTNKSSDTP